MQTGPGPLSEILLTKIFNFEGGVSISEFSPLMYPFTPGSRGFSLGEPEK